MLFLDDINGVLGSVRARAPAVDVDGLAGQHRLSRLVAMLQLDVAQRPVLTTQSHESPE